MVVVPVEQDLRFGLYHGLGHGETATQFCILIARQFGQVARHANRSPNEKAGKERTHRDAGNQQQLLDVDAR